jgi:hypothetical protein
VNVEVFVPRRADGGRRDELWAWVRDRWAREVPWPVHEGHHDDGPFNRSAAINAAAAKAGAWDVGIIADSDSFCGTEQLRHAVALASSTGRITFAYDRFMYLSRHGTDQVMGGYAGMWEPFVEWSLPGTCSSMVVVPRSLWDAVGGFDEGFEGWGMEDVGFSLACQALGGGMERVPGPVWHLHHTPSAENAPTPQFHRNVERMKRYEACGYDPAKMAELLASL